MLGLPFFSKFHWGSCVISFANTASKKIGALICSMKLISPEAALYLHNLSGLVFLTATWNCWICTIIGPSLAVSLEPLAHCWNLASLNLFYRYFFSRCSLELSHLVPFPCSRGRSTRYSDRFYSLFRQII